MDYARICAILFCTLVLDATLSVAENSTTTNCDPPCIHGTCEVSEADGDSIATCQCDPLWYGDDCSVFYCDRPEANPCRNGATCQPLANYTDYECQCAANYSGEFCTVSHFNCSNTTCSGHGNCSDNGLDPSGYQCECDEGFSGSNCEENIDDCVGVNCNNGTCVDGISSYYCSCNLTYTGSHCEDMDYCAIHSAEESNGCHSGICCPNGGTCINVPEEERHECACPPPWLAVHSCRRRAVLCADDPCHNGASCEDDGLQYTCTCPSGFTGRDCNVELRECTTNPCHNNASCLEVGVEQYCQCLPYTTGEFCESQYDPCDGVECHNGGSCRSHFVTGEYYTECQCADGYTGQDCSTDVDECLNSAHCENGATCTNIRGSFHCNCTSGFTGDRCQINIDDCVNVTCQNGGSCLDLTNNFQCNCLSGYHGKFCQWLTNQTCVGASNTRFGCTPDHTGECVDNFEGLNGKQIKRGNISLTIGFECRCNDGFVGDLCEGVVPYCNRNPCTSPDRYDRCITNYTNPSIPHCICKTGYEGEECEIDVDLCENSPCLHNGTCQDHGTYYSCQCPPRYNDGDNCSIEQCMDDTCGSNSQSCINSPTGPICQCNDGYTGSRCETIYDPCSDNPCLNEGTCNKMGNTFSCACPVGYTGDTCSFCLGRYCECNITGCEEKANNGICDHDCLNEQCHYDNSECEDRPDPWQDCTVTVGGLDCQHLFDNGVCERACATPACLLDGTDCLSPPEKQCPHQDYCDARYQSGECNKMCDNKECEFDGGDCDSQDTRKLAAGELFIILVLSEGTTFESVKHGFLLAMSELLNCIPIVKEFKELEGTSRVARQSSSRNVAWNITIELDVTHCTELCIETNEDARDILNAHRARGTFPPVSYNVTGITAPPPDDEDEKEPSSFPTLIVAAAAGVVLVLFVVGIVIGVKRKRAAATWHPNDRRSNKVDGERDTPSPLRRRSTMGDPVGQEDHVSLKSIGDEDFELQFGNGAVTYKKHASTTAWADIEPISDKSDSKRRKGKESFTVGDEYEDARVWAHLLYKDMRDYNKLKSALQRMEQRTGTEARHRDINAKGPGGYTALMMGVMQTSVAVMRGSLESKEEPMPEGAVASACVSIKDLLGLKADVNARNDKGQTALHIATACCTVDAVRQLLDAGSDINVQDSDGWTPLHVSVGAAAHNVFRVLLYHQGVNVDAQDHNGMTPLLLASKDCAVTMAKLLLDRRAEPGIADSKGKTALHWAASVNNVDGIRLLIQSNSNKDIQDQKGQSPLFLAAREGHIEAVRLLLECFANRNIVDNMDRSPMMIAEERRHTAVARMLGEWNITALSHEGPVLPVMATASGHMAAAMTSPSVVRRRAPADSFFTQVEANHPNIPQQPYDGSINTSIHSKMEYQSYHQQQQPCSHLPLGSNPPSYTIPPSASIHDYQQSNFPLPTSNFPSISVDTDGTLASQMMPGSYPPSNPVTSSLAVTRVGSNSTGSPLSVISPSNTSPLSHMDDPGMMPTTTSYMAAAAMPNVGPPVSSYQRDSMGNESVASDNTLIGEGISFPTPPSAYACDSTYPLSPFTLSAGDSVYLTPPPDPDSPGRWSSSPGKGKSPSTNEFTMIKGHMTNLPMGVMSEEPPPPYRQPLCLPEVTYPLNGQ